MISQIEDLVVELWLEIFSYLRIHQQFHAFLNLNQRINRLLFSYRSQFSLKSKDENSEYLLKYVLPYLSSRTCITGLRLENTKRLNLQYAKDLLHFPELRILTLHRLNIDQHLLDLFQQNATHLRYLYISSGTSGEKKYSQKMLQMILSLKNLHKCQLRLTIAMSTVQSTISFQSPIKFLRLLGMNENCSASQLMNLLRYLPNLQSLHLNINQLNFSSIDNSTINLSIPSISTFVLNINQFNGTFLDLTHFILIITPHVQELTITCHTRFENTTYLNTQAWKSLIVSLIELTKLTLNISYTHPIDDQTWERHCQKLSKSMTANGILFRLNSSSTKR